MSVSRKVLRCPTILVASYKYDVGDTVCITSNCKKTGLINEQIDYMNTPKYTVSFLDKRGTMRIEYFIESKLSPYIRTNDTISK